MLTPEDTLAIHVAAFEDYLGRYESSNEVIWIRFRPVGRELRERIAAHVEGATWTEWDRQLFDCPPGVEVSMPGRGCPIVGGRAILSLSPIEVEEDGSVLVGVTRTASFQNDEGRWLSYAAGERLRLERSPEDGWIVIEVLSAFIT